MSRSPNRTPRRRRLAGCAIAVAVALAALAADASASALDASLSSHLSSGGYGGVGHVRILYSPFIAKFENGPWMLKGIFPYLRIWGGSGTVEGPNGPIVTPNGKAEGFGDMILEGSYTWTPTGPYLPFVEMALRLKAPTASKDDGLGTGEADVTPELEFSRTYGRWSPIASLGFRVLGDPSGVKYHDGFLASAGLLYRLTEHFEPGAYVYWKQAATGSSDDSFELLPVARWHFGEAWSVDGYASFGFTDSAADFGGGLQLHYVWSGEK